MAEYKIDWLNKCRCGAKSATVKTIKGNERSLWDDDSVKCNACGREGVIQVCEGQARTLWETEEERAQSQPMTKFTKEQLIACAETALSDARTAANFHDSKPCHQMCVHLAEIALAVLSADIDKVSEEIVEQLVDGGTVDNAVTKHCVTFVKNKLSAMIGVC